MPSCLIRTPALVLHLLALLLLPLSANAQTSADEQESVAEEQATSGQQAAIEIIRLQHRSADSIRAAIEPLLDRRGSIGQMDNNLIIASTRANLNDLRALIEQLDIPRRTLRISVDFDYRLPAVAGTLDTASIDNTPPVSVQVLEGETAVLNEQRATDAIELLDGRAAAVTDRLVESQEIRVVAEIQGEQIQVELSAYEFQDDAAGLLSRTAATTLSVTPGRWHVINPLAALLPEPPQAGAPATFTTSTTSTTDTTTPAATDDNSLSTAPDDGRQVAVRIDVIQPAP